MLFRLLMLLQNGSGRGGWVGGRAPEFHALRQKTHFNDFICCEVGVGGGPGMFLPRTPKKTKKRNKKTNKNKNKNKTLQTKR